MGGEAALAEQDPPHLGGIDHQQYDRIQLSGERHRAGACAFGARLQQRAAVVGVDVHPPGVQARLQAGASGAHAHRTQSNHADVSVCSHDGLLVNIR